MITYDNFIKPLMEATEAVEKIAGRDEAYRFAMGSIEQTQKQMKNNFVAKIIGFFTK